MVLNVNAVGKYLILRRKASSLTMLILARRAAEEILTFPQHQITPNYVPTELTSHRRCRLSYGSWRFVLLLVPLPNLLLNSLHLYC